MDRNHKLRAMISIYCLSFSHKFHVHYTNAYVNRENTHIHVPFDLFVYQPNRHLFYNNNNNVAVASTVIPVNNGNRWGQIIFLLFTGYH